MTGNDLREKFLQFFASKNHLVLPSAPLIPENDPTLLLIGAGMAPFKPFFTGKMKPPHPRISTCQKCIRTGDIENVGRTARHHTFFEMLGNFSFGDYFKKEAIAWAWEFLTEVIKLPKEKLWITIYTEDDEAYEIWRNDIGIPQERIVRLQDNFWEIGPGPCGPCSEIHIDLGEERGCGSPDCKVGCDCDRYLEIWNLVFTQFDRDEAGNYTPLAKKNIDTGAGLERIASVLQNKPSNFETDLLFPIIEYTAKLAGITYGQSRKNDVSLKVIADHGRSLTVMIADGVLPSNEGRGYVLRRILRRAVRHGRLLGIDKLFLTDIVDIAAEIFAKPFPDIADRIDYIKKIVRMEEERFNETLVQGMELLNQHINTLKAAGKNVLDGATAFQLYDTYGFPWELTQEILDEHAISLDKGQFDAAMQEQRERARAARQDNEERVIIPDLSGLSLENLRYDSSALKGEVLVLLKSGQVVKSASDTEEVALITNITPFYAEGGGQVGDTGWFHTSTGTVQIKNTKKLPDGTIYHIGIVTQGFIAQNDSVDFSLETTRKAATRRNHTATHLMHAALKRVLGNHANQAGSYVGPDRLRFDFSHFSAVTAEELKEVEKIVNETILASRSVTTIETTQDMAKEMGAMALFGEKYGEQVRVVIVDDFSKELCGGTHVNNTAEVGLFKIVSEAGIGSGLRRIEAVTGQGALDYINTNETLLLNTAAILKSKIEELPAKADALTTHVKVLEKEISILHTKLASGTIDELFAKKITLQGVSVIVGQVEASDMDTLRQVADIIKDRLSSGIVVLGAIIQDKVNFVAMVTPDAVAKGAHAGNIVKEAAKIAGGGGGGRAEMAQAGGKDSAKLQEALAASLKLIQKQIG